jgi:hypothetical protein
VPATGHTYETKVTAPTCTTTGYTTYTCHCGHSYVADEVEALGHTEVIDASVEATCTNSGLTEGKHCSVCNEVLVAQQVVEPLGHTYSNEWKNNDIKHWHECNCGAKKDIEDHIYDEGVITKEPTTESEGEKTFTCKCGHQKINVLSKKIHVGCSGNSFVYNIFSFFGLLALAIFIGRKRKNI